MSKGARLGWGRARLGLGAAVLVSLALAGCSAATPTGPTTTGDPLDSPLASYLAAVTGFGDPDWRQQKQDEQTGIEQAVAQCMADQGFEYTPAVKPVRYSFDRGTAYDPDDPEWTAQWGYGVVLDPVTGGSATAAPDPNADYFATLDQSGQDAYDTALLGADLGGDDGGGLGATTGGCYGDAYREVHAGDPALAPANQSIEDALSTFFATQFDAPEYAEIDADWSGCMAGRGAGSFTRQADAEQSIRDALASSPADADTLDALHTQEVDLALADLACRDETDYRSRVKTVQDAQEQQFIDDHRDELDALVASAEAAG